MIPAKNLNILIVEDRIEDYTLTKECLDSLKPKHSHTLVSSMMDMEKEVKKNHFDVILLDLCLPETQGLPTVMRANEYVSGTNNEHTPIIILTGINDFEISKKALKYGVRDYLVKGEFTSIELNRALNFATFNTCNPKRGKTLFSSLFIA
jgi:CheY-like chemotaxis protein